MQVFTPPDTVMGRALASRACDLVNEPSAPVVSSGQVEYDLVHAAPVELPEVIRNAAKEALDRGETHYTTRPGIVPLRKAIAERTSAAGIFVTADDVVVTNGGVEALFIAMQTLVAGPGPIHIAGIAATSVHDMIRFLGGEPVEIRGDKEASSLPTPDAIAASGASTLIVQTPSPLTGAAYCREDILRIFETAGAAGMTVVLDESVSSNLVSSTLDEPFAVGDNLKLTTIGSFSADYGMAGWRIGWFTAAAPHIKSMSGFKQALSICTTAVSQYAALAALEESRDWLAERHKSTDACKQEVLALLQDAHIPVLDPGASSYLLIKTDDLDSNDRSVRDALMADAGILVEAGSDLHDALQGFVRINAAAVDPVDGVQRLISSIKGRDA